MSPQFLVDQTVIHKREGLAKIVSTALIADKQYYLLKAARGDGEMIYVPGDSSTSIIRPIMNPAEAQEVLDYMASVKMEYTSNTKQRRDFYKRLLNSGETEDIAFLTMQLRIYELSNHDSENPDMKLGVMDIDLLSKADNILMDELALTYDKSREDIKEFIFKKINR